ncbi:MAG: carbon starvation protein A [Candidatus Omnitrophica bacterium]|nr:carbon starvation protein A [Candidatus Omnitrophota bacterium]MCF7892431.1 carbon starvation protein A [Candidatus Omnitrophota bacterium]MCF7897610.1 carbon starvation protein A [Candidatus Omnitrophota bacterium]MCF7909582.1 carbon starvation protein A [Candidatus Omnitrophota bacterium]
MSAVIFFLVLLVLLGGYFIYGRLVSNVLGIDYQRKTPAFSKKDGLDYIPAKNWLVLFGHHFASIAGAGPIVGPVFAYIYWGWIGVLIWIVFGSIFLGAVHDFVSLFISVREDGLSIGRISQKYISRPAGIVFLIFLWCALILVIAVFANASAKSFVNEPEVVLPSLGIIPIAMLIGFFIYRLKKSVVLSTFFGLACLSALIYLGAKVAIILPVADPYLIWVLILFIYAFFASIIPVDILLQPRDYISSFLLLFGLAISFLGIFAKPLPVGTAQFFKFNSEIGPMFPLMFITVACGAISGFHSLVASGTSSKQLPNEADAKKIGYGSMIVEAVLSAVALFCVAFGLKNIPVTRNPVEIFAQGFGQIVFFLGDYAKFIALVILNAFILTTLDTATRITRFLTQELFNVDNKYLATLLVIVVAGAFCLSGTFETLWPMFGASNQLVAGLALVVATAYLIDKKKNYKITLFPALIMFIITITALALMLRDFFQAGNYLNLALTVVLIFLGVFILVEFVRTSLIKKRIR